MPNYPVQEILFSDGEGIDLADLNGAQRSLRAQLWDLAVGGRARSIESSNGPASGRLHAFGPAAAPVASATARTITAIGDGTLGQRAPLTTIDGADPKLLAYHATAAELTSTLDVGDAQPRIDLISIKLEHIDNDAADAESRIFKNYSTGALSTAAMVKRRKVKITKTVTKGTPAASPTTPSLPSGHVAWCSVYVPASHNAVIDPDNIRDHRYPIGFDLLVQHTDGLAGGVWASAGWTVLGSTPGIQSGGTSPVYIRPPLRLKHSARLSSIGIMGLLTGCTVQLVRQNLDNTSSAGGETVLADLSSAFTGGANQLYSTDESHANWSRPIWGNGFTAGLAALQTPAAAPNDSRMAALALKITPPSAGRYVKFVEWGVLC